MRTSKKFEFINASKQALAGRLESPSGEPLAYALFAHCFTCSKDNVAATRIARGLTRYGVAVLRFDFTGLGNSEGDFANTNFSSNVADLVSAAEHLGRIAQAPKILIGHSLGGAAVLVAAGQLEDVQAVATINAPSDVNHVTELFQCHLQEIESAGEALVRLDGREFRIQKQFIDDLREENVLTEKIAALRKALIIFHAPEDATVPIGHAGRIYSAAKHPKSFIALDGANHLLTRKEDAEYVADTIGVWCRRYIRL